MSQPSTVRPITRGLLATLVCLSALGCGDDNDNPTTVTPSNHQNLQNGVDELVVFGDDVFNGPGGQIVQNQPIVDLLNSIIPGVGGFIPLVVQSPTDPAQAGWWSKVLQTTTTAGPDSHFGTYERDAADATMPFPGWVLVQAGDPPDGLIFLFDLQDDIVGTTDQGVPVPLQGAVRFVDIVVDEGMPETPDDDILTHVTFEVAASPIAGPLFELVRVPLTIVLGENREPVSVAIGDPTAVDTHHPDAAVLGDILLAVQIGLTPGSSAPLFDLQALAQLFDSVERFALRADLLVEDLDLQSGLMQSISVGFGWGSTDTPDTPPWQVAVTASDFWQDVGTGDIHAGIDGGIVFNGAPLAIFDGSTAPTTILIDGDEVQCPSVTVTFTDDPENPLNICEALPILAGVVLPVP